jgi:hypothetical protein
VNESDVPDEVEACISVEQAAAESARAGELLRRNLGKIGPSFTPRCIYWAGIAGLDSPKLANLAIAYLKGQGVITLQSVRDGMPLYGITKGAKERAPSDPPKDTPQSTSGNPPRAYFMRDRKKWCVRQTEKSRRMVLGFFPTLDAAREAYPDVAA